VRAVLSVLLVIGFVVTYWWLIVLVLAVTAVGLALWLGHQRRLEAGARRRCEHAALVARADQQHAWVLAGDNRGVYGQYPPRSP